MSIKAKKPRLGRGLSSLIATPIAVEIPPGDAEPAVVESPAITNPQASSGPAPASPEATQGVDGLIWLALDAIEPNPYQPRRTFNEEALKGLAESIRRDGVMQPVVVRRRQVGDGTGAAYQLVAGERRWRAARLAGLAKIPAIPHELDDEQLAEWAVVENLHREDLDPIERAEAFDKLIDQFGLTHDQVAERVGVDRSTITNTLRLLELSSDIRDMIRSDNLSAGHGRALLGIQDREAQVALARRAVAGGWSVRMVEATVRRLAQAASTAVTSKPSKSAHLADLERQIAAQLQTKVRIKSGRKKGTGTLSLEFFTIEQFDDLLQKLGVRLD